MIDVANFLFSFFISLFNEFSTWGVIGFGIIGCFVFVRVANFIKRFIK